MVIKRLIPLAAVAAMSVSGITTATAEVSAAPPGAIPGQCFARVLLPAKYEINPERVLVKEATKRVRVLPTTYNKVVERVLVKEAGEKLLVVDSDGFPFTGPQRPRVKRNADGSLEILPGAYNSAYDRHEVKQSTHRYETTAARFKTVTERVLVRPARTVWQYNVGDIYSPRVVRDGYGEPVTRIDEGGRVLCLVNEPAQYVTLKKKVVETPPRVRKLPVEAKYKSVERKIPKRLEVRRIRTPAEFKTITRMVVKNHARIETDDLPAKYKTVDRKFMLRDSSVVWRRVLCETNINGGVVLELQTILRNQGYNPGPIDGAMGGRTMAAVRDYQRVNGLAVGGLTIEALNALGITLPDGMSY